MKRSFLPILSALCALLVMVACATSTPAPALFPTRTSQSPASASSPASTPSAPVQKRVYTDAKLGFQLTVPVNWQASPEPGSSAASGNSAVTFTENEQSSRAVIVIGVFHGASLPAAFAARGTPTAHIGAYPAFVADRLPGEGRAPCLVRIFLAHDDYVLADWCSPTALAYGAQFESVLATYQPAPPVFASDTSAAPAAQNCTGMQRQLGYASAAWGRELAAPAAPGWRQAGTGIFVCSNDGSPDWYLFQCTELINRFLYERWALPHLPGNAARYYDYYQNGVLILRAHRPSGWP